MVSYNDWSLNSSKHDVFVKYTQSAEIEYLLEIHDVNMNDEVMYECQAGGDRARAILTVTGTPFVLWSVIGDIHTSIFSVVACCTLAILYNLCHEFGRQSVQCEFLLFPFMFLFWILTLQWV